MRKVLLSKIEPGMVLGKNLFSPHGHILLSDGAELSPVYLTRLQALGFSAVMIKEDYCRDLVLSEVVSEKARVDGVVALRHIFGEARKSRKIDTRAVKSLVNKFVDEILQNRRLLFEIPDIRSYDNYLYGHCVNVCIMALRVGLMLDYNEFQLRDLGVGALLHDIGTVFIEKNVVEKAGELTASEMEKIKMHSVEGFNLLREQRDINLLSAHVAFQHHERVDGNGYPRSLKSADICEFAKIVAIADLFDALTNERKYRRSYSYCAAVDIIRKEAGRKLDPDLAERFLKNIAVYPTGSLVELNTGEIGLVLANSRPYVTRPVIRIVTDNQKRVLVSETFREVDLRREKNLTITGSIENEDLVTADLRKLYRDRLCYVQ